MSWKKLNSSIGVPVIMYHSVGLDGQDWIWRHLTMPLKLFEDQMRTLSEKGFNSINLPELYGYMKYNKKIPESSIVLTFDDGYLDNWVYAFPILKKYGLNGTIFVNPEFVDPTEKYRPNLGDVLSGNFKEEELNSKGFLSWREMRKMEEEGVMDIQSHSMTHTWYFSDDEIVDFHYPGNDRYPWLFWNTCPERKSYYMNENQEFFVPYGTPVYRHGRSLGVRRYFEDKEFSNYLVKYVENQGEKYFADNNWKEKLLYEAAKYRSERKMNDRFETDEELEQRFRYELIDSRRILEQKLNKKVHFLCWAGGAFTNQALAIADEAGYLASTLYYNNMNRKNTFGEDPSKINRTGCVSAFSWKNSFISYTNASYFIANIKHFCGSKRHFWIMRVFKVQYLIAYFIKKLVKRGER